MGDIIKTAQCRFCGQMVQIETDKELTQPQAEEQATMTCGTGRGTGRRHPHVRIETEP